MALPRLQPSQALLGDKLMTINLEKQNRLTHERLTALLDYCAESGTFHWRVSRQGRTRAGDRAGSVVKGYREIKIDQVDYYEHRLAWFYIIGEWPSDVLDHIDLDKSNNRFSNLRDATGSTNQFNRKCPARNRVGMKGVSWCSTRGKWRATIRAYRKSQTLGYFNSPEEAYATYVQAARRLHGSFANTG
jgi:HNH endonuclease